MKPMLQHCAVGKDRTGIGVAITLFALGASEDTVMDDYLVTEKTLAKFREKILSEFAPQLTDVELESHRNLFAAKEIYLASAISAVKEKYQTIDNWLATEYGISREIKQQLQNKYLA